MNGIAKLAAIAVLGLAGTAEAQMIVMHAVGYANPDEAQDVSFTDVNGLFGPAGASIAEGTPVSITFVLHVDKPLGVSYDPSTDWHYSYYSSPETMTVTMTVGGHSITQQSSLDKFNYADLQYSSDPVSGPYSYSQWTMHNDAGFAFQAYISPDDYSQFAFGTLDDAHIGTATGLGSAFSVGYNGEHLAFVASSASLSGLMPEPASWAMMVAGFGLAGAAMRRRAVRSVA